MRIIRRARNVKFRSFSPSRNSPISVSNRTSSVARQSAAAPRRGSCSRRGRVLVEADPDDLLVHTTGEWTRQPVQSEIHVPWHQQLAVCGRQWRTQLDAGKTRADLLAEPESAVTVRRSLRAGRAPRETVIA